MPQIKFGKYIKLVYILAIFLFFEAFILSGGQGIYPLYSNIFFATALVCSLIGTCFMFVSKESNSYLLQITIAFLLFGFFWNVNFICVENGQENTFMKIFGAVSLNLSSVLCLIKVFQEKRIKKTDILNFFRSNKEIIILILLYSLLFLQNLGLWFVGDDYIYYNAVVEKSNQWDFTLNTLSAFSLGGHASYAYAFFLSIGNNLWSTLGNGVRMANLCMSCITIFCFYQILGRIFRNMSKMERCLISALFAFSPLFWGISYSVNVDYALLCFFVFFVYANLYHKTVFEWLAVLAVCFSKELGVFVIAFYYIGECINGIVKSKEGLKGFFRNAFSARQMAKYSAVLFCLVNILLSKDGWIVNFRNIFSGNNKAAPLPNYVSRVTYILYKLEEIFVMNFHWIILLFFVLCLCKKIRSIYKKEKKEGLRDFISKNTMVLPFGLSFLGYIALSTMYFTYVHYRYVQLCLFFYAILLGALIYYGVKQERVRKVILVAISVIFVLDSYCSIDPVTHQLFPHFNAGNRELVSTRRYFYGGPSLGYGYKEGDDKLMADHLMSEGLEYSRVQTQLQNLLEDALKRIDCTSDKLIVLDMSGGWIENTCRQLFGVSTSEGYYWDIHHQTVTRTPTDIKLNFTNPNKKMTLDNYSEVYYFDFPFNEYRSDNFLEQNPPIDHFTEESGAWKFEVYRVK